MPAGSVTGKHELAHPAACAATRLLSHGWFGGAFLGTGDSNPIFQSEVMLGRVRGHWPQVRGDRSSDQRFKRHPCGPAEVHPGGCPDGVGEDRIAPPSQRMRKPCEKPDVGIGVAKIFADEAGREMSGDATSDNARYTPGRAQFIAIANRRPIHCGRQPMAARVGASSDTRITRSFQAAN